MTHRRLRIISYSFCIAVLAPISPLLLWLFWTFDGETPRQVWDRMKPSAALRNL